MIKAIKIINPIPQPTFYDAALYLISKWQLWEENLELKSLCFILFLCMVRSPEARGVLRKGTLIRRC